MRHIRAHSTAHDAVPSWKEHCIEFVFDDFSDVVEHSSLLEGEGHAVNSLLLHVGVHVCELDDSVFSLLLVEATVSLNNLFVLGWLPFFCFLNSGVGDRSLRSHNILY